MIKMRAPESRVQSLEDGKNGDRREKAELARTLAVPHVTIAKCTDTFLRRCGSTPTLAMQLSLPSAND
jgi:hypothetical protein